MSTEKQEPTEEGRLIAELMKISIDSEETPARRRVAKRAIRDLLRGTGGGMTGTGNHRGGPAIMSDRLYNG